MSQIDSHTTAGFMHLFTHTPYDPADILSILFLLATIPVFVLLPAIDAVEGYSKLSMMLYILFNLVMIAIIVLCRVSLSIQWFDPAKQSTLNSLHHGIMDLLVLVSIAVISHEGSLMASLVWHGHFFDHDVQVVTYCMHIQALLLTRHVGQAVEHAAWACQPSVELHNWEYLMGAHACWPLVLTTSLLVLRRPTDDEAYAITAGLLVCTIFFCTVIAICFPVKGPRQSLAQLEAESLGTFSPRIVLFLADLGIGNNLSLPSQRTALAVALWLSAMRYNAYLGCALVLVIPALIVGTIYAGLNYTLDVIIGIFVASISYTMGSQVVSWMYNRTCRRRELWNGGGCCKLDKYDLSYDTDLKYATEQERLTSGDMFI